MQQNLDAIFSALSDPTRRAIVARLSQGAATVAELADPFDLAQPTISKHLKVLEEAGLIATRRQAQSRPRELCPIALKGIADWLEDYSHFWRESFDRLDAYIEKTGGNEK
ncbi:MULTISPECIES: ArsR/SmtB family transcription factor [Rhizobium]|uniref:DNA-binding transcriptional regulator, ArsR family n=1 Tax=Rhizobium miluonense TaxID=411945 RepID=A0A1C3VEE9_9HYPH|nr:metalloregulator ArsR/SmtB family transcription factor [Rhizobium miluonense]SCB26172.1 DNA-binding transcriptional regulator, ArsR family [Rhizobium miluonense]